ncbi:MAG: sigma-70 family RNA polymerase sigma factor [Burkholderiales bacterium]
MAVPDTEALARLRPRLLAFALRRARDRAAAEDAVQDALLAALEGREGFAGQSTPATWVFGILRHKIVDGLRCGPREESLEGELDELPHAGPGPEQLLARARALETFARSLDRLPDNSARAFVLREVAGYDTPEVCRALGITPANCWVRVHRARARLRKCPDIGRLAAEAA